MTQKNKEEIFEEYRQLVHHIDQIFQQVKQMHGDLVKCRIGCDDCCHAFFELTPVEALYIHERFREKLSPAKKEEVLRRTRDAHARYRKIVTNLRRAASLGPEEKESAMKEAGQQRIACPLLNDQHQCDLYEDRPITCRVYGMPTLIQNAARFF